MSSKKKSLYDDYFNTHFNVMYNGVFSDAYDTYDNRYNWCHYDYINFIKYDRSKRKYVNVSNKYILVAMFAKTRLEERSKIEELAYDVVLPFECIKSSLPSGLPEPILNIIYLFYRQSHPCVRELQEWFGENSNNKNYHDNEYEAQRSLILEFADIDKYFPGGVDISSNYFKSHDVVYDTDDTPRQVEIKSSKNLLDYLKQHTIPYELSLPYYEGETMIDYGIPFESDSD